MSRWFGFITLFNLGQLNFYEYIFCIYPLRDPTVLPFRGALDGVRYLRKTYSNLEALNEKNKAKVLEHLNEKFGTEFQQNDIWTKNTTAVNQENYMRGHIYLFEGIVQYDSKTKVLSIKKREKIDFESAAYRNKRSNKGLISC